MKKILIIMVMASMSLVLAGANVGFFAPAETLEVGGTWSSGGNGTFGAVAQYSFSSDMDFTAGLDFASGSTPISIGVNKYFNVPADMDQYIKPWVGASYTAYSGTSSLGINGNVGYSMNYEGIRYIPYIGLTWVNTTAGGVSVSSTDLVLGVQADFTPNKVNKILAGLELQNSNMVLMVGYTF
ncbi:MAG: hypothetical protein PHF25_05680 [Candidatus Margulisbacteria bacterium]|nr:hypothetical protein [Candidatus Margulisiibacteriota bacterium]